MNLVIGGSTWFFQHSTGVYQEWRCLSIGYERACLFSDEAFSADHESVVNEYLTFVQVERGEDCFSLLQKLYMYETMSFSSQSCRGMLI
jgi:hypothetical protein